MPKGKESKVSPKPELTTIRCSICGSVVSVETYANHIQTVHTSPPPQPSLPEQPPQPPQASLPAWQGSGQVQGSVGQVTPSAPPPMPTFINRDLLYQLGGAITAQIVGVRGATGGRPEYVQRGGFFLDVVSGGVAYVARIGIGDTRHHTLWKKYGADWVGKTVRFRLTTPSDLDPRGRPTRAYWVIE